VLNQYFATVDAPRTASQWSQNGNGCPTGQTVLGDNSCARQYYRNRWGHNASEWHSFPNRPSGEANIAYASEHLVDGDPIATNGLYY
jgi:hypothetical protein